MQGGWGERDTSSKANPFSFSIYSLDSLIVIVECWTRLTFSLVITSKELENYFVSYINIWQRGHFVGPYRVFEKDSIQWNLTQKMSKPK